MTMVLMAAPLRIWLPQDVAERLKEAARTLCWLAMPKYGLPSQVRSGWPEIVQGDIWETFNNLTEEQRQELVDHFNRLRLRPTAQQVSRAFEAIEWVYTHIKDPRNRRAIMGAALGISYRRLAKQDGRDPKTIKSLWLKTCEELAEKL